MSSLVSLPVSSTIFRMSIPTFIGYILQSAVLFFEMVVLAPLGQNVVVAVGFVSLFLGLVSFFNDIPGGASLILISQSMGKNDYNTVRSIIKETYYLKFIPMALLCVLLLPFFSQVMLFIGAKPEQLSYVWRYGLAYFLVQPLVFCNWTFFTSMRAMGEPQAGMWFMIFRDILHFMLIVILVKVLHFGVLGASLAYATAQIFCFITTTVFLASSHCLVPLNIFSKPKLTSISLQILRVGIPLGGRGLPTKLSNFYVAE